MGYRKIRNLYDPRIASQILSLGECYATEKIHGTSAHIKVTRDSYVLFAGGIKHDEFTAMIEEKYHLEEVVEKARSYLHDTDISITFFGEAYGGKCQKMSHVYGPLNFVVFEVKIETSGGDIWNSVPLAEEIARNCGLEFVHFERGPATIKWLNAQRDKPSVQAERNGLGTLVLCQNSLAS